jgi:hypothetical protein
MSTINRPGGSWKSPFKALALATLLTGCTTDFQYPSVMENRPDFLPESYTLSGLPWFPSTELESGAGPLTSLLAATGLSTALPSEIAPMLYEQQSPTTFQTDVRTTIRSFGLIPYPLAPRLIDIIVEIASGNPVLALQGSGGIGTEWSYVLVKGFDFDRELMIVNTASGENVELPLREFERRWVAGNRQSVMAVAPGELPTTADAGDYHAALSALQQIDATDPELEAAYQRGLEEWPEDRNLLMGFGQYLMDSGQYFQASDVFSETMNLYPGYGMAHNNMARALIELGRLDEARFHANEAVATDDEFNEIYVQTLEVINRRARSANRNN